MLNEAVDLELQWTSCGGMWSVVAVPVEELSVCTRRHARVACKKATYAEAVASFIVHFFAQLSLEPLSEVICRPVILSAQPICDRVHMLDPNDRCISIHNEQS